MIDIIWVYILSAIAAVLVLITGICIRNYNLLEQHLKNSALEQDKKMQELSIKNIEIVSIVDSITDGIVAVDHDINIILINPAACNTFGIAGHKSLTGNNLARYIRNNQINSVLKETIIQNKPFDTEVITDDKILSINTFPLKTNYHTGDVKTEDNSNSGGIVFIQDITKMRKLEKIRTEFVSNVTHELKTPITSIRGFIETLKNGALDNHKVAARFLDIIDIEAERLYALINDILQLSEIETKQKDTDLELFSLKILVESVFEIVQNIALEKKISLRSNVNENLFIEANRNRMKQLLINLIDNGIKYNIENGKVIVDAYRVEGKIIISVKDTGIGIPAEHFSRIFERFYRVDKGRSRETGGTGLGLSIVKHIVNLYNGDIKVYSEEGKGSEFVIQIPAENRTMK